MSAEHHNTGPGAPAHGTVHGTGGAPRHDTVAFETHDVQVRTIYWYLFSLAVATILAFASAVVILRATSKMVVDAHAPTLPMRKEMTEQQKLQHAYPPEPRLQGVPGHENDPQQDLREKLLSDNQANEQLRWLDRSSGIAQIPVSEAMKLVVERGVHGSAPAAKPADSAKAAPAAKGAVPEKTN